MKSAALGVAAGDVLWQALVDSVPFYVAVLSPDRRILFSNQAGGAFGPGDWVGRSLVGAGPGVGALGPVLDRVLVDGHPKSVEIPVSVDPGTTAWLRLHLSRLQGPGGDLIGVLAVAMDVTESKQASIELRMSVNALHRLIDAREQLSHDLHDGILQSLYGVGLRLEAARAALRTPGGDVPGHLGRAVAQLNETMTEIRRFIAGGDGNLPTGMPWAETLVGMLRGLEVDGGARVEVQVEPETADRVPQPHRSDFLLIAREAVSNAIRHADARRIVVRLVAEGRTIRLEVDDDGRGLGAKTDDSGIGVLTMTRRASRIGATLTLHSTPQSGTLVRVELTSPEGGLP
jgi:signal transduction histidine kinase